VTVVDGVSRKKLYLCAVMMGLDSLAVVLSLNEIRPSLSLKKIDFFFTCQHGPNGTEESDFIIKRNVGVLKLFAYFQQVVGQVEKVVGVFVETVQD
jgi:hypothetical protein